MRKWLNKPWVVALLAVAAVFFVVQSLRDSGHTRVRAPAVHDQPFTEAADEAMPGEPQAATLADALKALSLNENLPDPFEPRRPRTDDAVAGLERVPDDVETLHLSAVWRQGDEQLAFVNGRIVRAGESIGRITFETFERDGVWLTHWKGRDFLRLGDEFTLITPAAHAATLETADDER